MSGDFAKTVLEIMDLRSFSSLWYWIVLASVWSINSYFVLGVPMDMITQARRSGGEDAEDMVDLARIHITRRVNLVAQSGVILLAVVAFAATSLIVLGWGYGVEFCQALFLILAPLGIAFWMGYRASLAIIAANPDPQQLIKMLLRHRFFMQVLGMIAIFISAMWGMWVNLNTPVW